MDNNCDGIIDEGCQVCEDKDNDGRYAVSEYCPEGDDPYDNDLTVYPGAPELCDNKDNNCDGETDEGCCEIGDVTLASDWVAPKMPPGQPSVGNTQAEVRVSLTRPAPAG
ncbi:MAG: putative metal-binding motif-containing protein, partial [Nitrospirae bacterium]|nr:putative metal-binding motif-containing protein [Nitrospirota bacterium]